MDDYTFWGGFFTVIVIFLTYVYFSVRKAGGGALEPDSSMFRVDVELPDPTPYQKIKEARPEKPGPDFNKWHKSACMALMERAKKGLSPFHEARTKVNELALVKQNATKVGLQGAVHEEAWTSAQESLKNIMQEIAEVEREARWLQPGAPGWEAGIYQEATDILRKLHSAKQARKKAAAAEKAKKEEAGDDDDDDDDNEPANDDEDEDGVWLNALRFDIGQMVACNMGQKGFVAGWIVGNWRLPYVVLLTSGERVFAPQDSDQIIRAYKFPNDPESQKRAAELKARGIPTKEMLSLWRPFRFKPGDRIVLNLGETGWRPGIVTMVNWRSPKWPPGQFAAYQIKLDGTDDLVFTPRDHDNFIRAFPTS